MFTGGKSEGGMHVGVRGWVSVCSGEVAVMKEGGGGGAKLQIIFTETAELWEKKKPDVSAICLPVSHPDVSRHTLF